MKKIITFFFFITLLPNQILFGTTSLLSYVKFALIAFLVWHFRFIKSTIIPKSIQNIKYFVFLSIIVLIGIFRDNSPFGSFAYSIFRALYFVIYFWALALIYFYYKEKENIGFVQLLFKIILLPAYILYSLNIVLWILGVAPIFDVLTGESLGESVFLSLFGLNINRVQFPLAPGFNDYAAQVTLTLSVSIGLLYDKTRSFNRRYLILGILICFVSILLIDSRTSFITPFLILICLKFFERRTKLIIVIISFIFLLLGPFLVFVILPQLSGFEFLNSISRSDNDIVSGNARFIIWGYVINELSSFRLEHLWGFGEYGHFGSKVSMGWADLLSGYTNSELKTPHSTLFSIILDYGYIGLFFYSLLFIRLIKIMKVGTFYRTPVYNVIFALFLANTLNGLTETVFGFYFQNYTYTFLSIIFLVFLVTSNNFDGRKEGTSGQLL